MNTAVVVVVNSGVTTGLITGAVTVLASLILMYFPKLNVWFAGKPTEYKQWFFLLLTLLVGVLLAASSCLNLWVYITCDKFGFMTLGEVLVAVIVGVAINQGVYKLLPEPNSVTLARAAR